jgi:hypothetical protein
LLVRDLGLAAAVEAVALVVAAAVVPVPTVISESSAAAAAAAEPATVVDLGAPLLLPMAVDTEALLQQQLTVAAHHMVADTAEEPMATHPGVAVASPGGK